MKRLRRCIWLLQAAAMVSFVESPGQGYLCAVGGGSEDYNSWSDAPYRWIVQRADSQQIIVLAASSQTSWIPTYFVSLGAKSAVNYIIPSVAAANDSATYRAIRQSRGVFVKGGDQWQYVSLWRGTLAEQAIREVFLSGGVVAGTSAGAMILSSVVSDAHYGTSVSRAALRNPRSQNLSTTTDFLRLLPGSLIDSHFHERGRLGRLLAMVGNRYHDNGERILGIGIEDQTALCITPEGIGEVMGSGSVSFFYPSRQSIVVSTANRPFVFTNVNFDALVAGFAYDLNAHETSSMPPTAIEVGPAKAPVFYKVSLFGDAFPTSVDLSRFIEDAGGGGMAFGVVTSPGAEPAGLRYRDSLLARGAANVVLVVLDMTSANDPEAARAIEGTSGIVFTSNLSGQFHIYADSTTLVGGALLSRLRSGMAVAYASQDGKLAGKTVVFGTELEEYAAYRGKLLVGDGMQAIPDFLVMPLIFQSDVYDENRCTGLVWGMAKTGSTAGLFLDEGSSATVDQNGVIGSGGLTPSLVVDAREATHVGFSTYLAPGGTGPRQSAAIIGAKIHSIAGDVTLSLRTGEISTGVRGSLDVSPKHPLLLKSYPNPFNPTTTLVFTLDRPSYTRLVVFDVLGRELVTLLDGPIAAGAHRVAFDGALRGSAVYFARLQTTDESATVKVLLIK